MKGFFSPLEGAKLILSNPKYFVYSIIPFLLGIGFVFLGYVLAAEFFTPLVENWVQSFEFFKDWKILAGIINFLLLIVTWILVSIVNFLAGYVCISILGGPFYSILVEKIFSDELPHLSQQSGLKVAFNMFWMSLIKMLLFVLVGLGCFVLTFFPPLNFVASFVLLLMVAFDCSDYSFEVSRLNIGQRVRFFRQHFWEYSGLSLAILLTSVIPGAFFVLLPVFICGATKMYIQLNRQAV